MGHERSLLYVVDSDRGSGSVLDLQWDTQRCFVIFDGGPRPDQKSNTGSKKPPQVSHARSLVSAAKSAWGRLSAPGQSAPFSPTALVSLGSHDPYESLVALLQQSGDQVLQSTFKGPFIIPNPVNIQDGWKLPPAVKGRFSVIGDVLKSLDFKLANSAAVLQSLPGTQFIIPAADKMFSCVHVPSTIAEDMGKDDVLDQSPNSHSVLFKASLSGEGNEESIVLTRNCPPGRISPMVSDGSKPHYSIFQMQRIDDICDHDIQIDPEISQEFTLWALLELGYSSLGFCEDEVKNLPPLTDGNTEYSGLASFVSGLSPCENGERSGRWHTARDTGATADWLRQIELSQDPPWLVPQAIHFLATMIKNEYSRCRRRGSMIAISHSLVSSTL